MKHILIMALAWVFVVNAGAGLTGTQIQQIIAWNDRFGYVYMGSRDVEEIQDGRPFLQKVMLFYRATDATYACCATDCPTVDMAQSQLIGSKLMCNLIQQMAGKTPSSGAQ